jgi:beta-lactamase superfamily II metal-dependent hydrolase
VPTKPSRPTPKTTPADVPVKKPNQLLVTALGVGHGDAILIEWNGDVVDKQWTCLIDGGGSPKGLQQRLEAREVKHIDLLILSHLDSDHVGGLNGLEQFVSIGSYWGPALPAFARHQWLFGSRGTTAIERGQALETALSRTGVEILYPLEGYASAPIPDRIHLSVLSPAARLIGTLLTSDDVSDLVSSEPMP